MATTGRRPELALKEPAQPKCGSKEGSRAARADKLLVEMTPVQYIDIGCIPDKRTRAACMHVNLTELSATVITAEVTVSLTYLSQGTCY